MTNLRMLSIAVFICLIMLGGVLAAPESFGISAVTARWLGLVATGLGALATVLPRAQGPTTDPETIASRIVAMPPAQRRKLRAAVERREPMTGPAAHL